MGEQQIKTNERMQDVNIKYCAWASTLQGYGGTARKFQSRRQRAAAPTPHPCTTAQSIDGQVCRAVGCAPQLGKRVWRRRCCLVCCVLPHHLHKQLMPAQVLQGVVCVYMGVGGWVGVRLGCWGEVGQRARPWHWNRRMQVERTGLCNRLTAAACPAQATDHIGLGF